MRLLIQIALAVEARPLLDRWRWRRVSTYRAWAVYHRVDMDWWLVVSGTGVAAASASVAALLAKEGSFDLAINLGCAGATPEHFELGEWVLIHEIKDAASRRVYYPDALYRHSWKEGNLLTVGEPERGIEQGLVDMEGSGFFVGGRSELSVHQLVLLKVVSDFGQGERINRQELVDWIEGGLNSLEAFIGSIENTDTTLKGLPDTVMNQISIIVEQWRLSETQKHQLTDLIWSIWMNGNTDWACLDKAKNRTFKHKVDRNKAFNDFCDELAAKI